MHYRSDIDGLRAIAVLAVMLNHFSPGLLPGGYLGVDVFFVISGYVITASLHGRDSRGLADLLLAFYLRRIKRLLPALAVFVAVTAFLISLFNPAPRESLMTGMLSIFGLSNLYLIALGADYFGQSVQLNPFTHTWSLGWWSVPILLALTFAAAALSYRYVEVPARRATWSATRTREIGLGLGCAAALFAVVFALADTHEGKLYAGRRPTLAKTGTESLIETHSVAGTTWGGLRCVLTHNAQAGRHFDVHPCTLGNFDTARRRVLLVGDSFAAAFTEAFDELVTRDGYAVTIVAAWGASPVREVPNGTVLKAANDYYWDQVVPELVAKLRPGDWTVVVNDMAAFSPAEQTPGSRERLAQLQAGLERMSQDLAARGIGLAVLHGNPLLREAKCDPSMAASQWFSPAGRPCQFLTKEATLQRRSVLDHALGELKAAGRITVIDLMDLFCPGSTCEFEDNDGTILYRDMHSHPSVEGARMAAPLIRRLLLESRRP